MNRIACLACLLSVCLSTGALAQTDNCEPLIQSDGVVSIAMQAGGRDTVAVLNTNILPFGMSGGLARELGLTVQPVPSRNVLWSAIPGIVGQVSDVPVHIFDQDLQIEQMYVMELARPVMLLSLFMFSDFIMQLDLPKSNLCFLNRRAIDLREAANLKVRNNNGRAAVQVAINQAEPVWLELQLEYPGAIRLNRAAALALGFASPTVAGEPMPTAGLASGQADSLQFGPYELGNIAVVYPSVDEPEGTGLPALGRRGGRGGGLDIAGSLGYEVLKHFVVTLDMEAERLHVFVPQ
ncbi:MAG: hypothetical protein RLZZ385_2325 [Pseudomonadota bacterium]|jgi:hypothetical protein